MRVHPYRRANRHEAGFTLLELMLSLSVLTILSGSSYVLFVDVSERGRMDTAVYSVVALVERAKARAGAGDMDAPWGVRLEQPLATVFKGDAYDTRDLAYDEIIEIPYFEIDGDLEYVFEKGSGNPREAGAVTITNEQSGEVRTLSINEKGVVEIE